MYEWNGTGDQYYVDTDPRTDMQMGNMTKYAENYEDNYKRERARAYHNIVETPYPKKKKKLRRPHGEQQINAHDLLINKIDDMIMIFLFLILVVIFIGCLCAKSICELKSQIENLRLLIK